MFAVNELFDYRWSYTQKKSYLPRVESFSKQFVEKPIPIAIYGDNTEDYENLISRLLEIIDRDVANNTPGRLYVGKSFLNCYFIASEKPGRYLNTKKTTLTLTLLAEDGNWFEETTFQIGAITNSLFSGDTGHDHPYDYPYDYANGLIGRVINNTSYVPSDFVITIYGSCENPTIGIGTNTYKVNDILQTGEYLRIDSMNKTIYKIQNNGRKINLYNFRDRENYIFEKIAEGVNNVAWNGAFGFDITLITRRSEPRWI